MRSAVAPSGPRSGWGVGALPMTVAGREPWMDPALPTVTLLYSHQDQVTALPTGRPGARVGRRTAPSPCSRSATTSSASRPIPSSARRTSGPCSRSASIRIGVAETAAALATLEAPTDERATARWILAFLHRRVAQS